MNAHFGLEAHSDPSDHDDGSDDFIIEKYRTQLEDSGYASGSASTSYDYIELELARHIETMNRLSGEISDAAKERILRNTILHRPVNANSHGESDNAALQDDTVAMNDITREELDAKLDATNARLEARLSSFEGAIRETLSAVRQDSAEMRGELKVMHGELSGLKNIKGSIWGAAGATVIGVGGIIAAMLGFGVASFDSGRETSQLVEAAKQQTTDTRKLLEQIQAQQKSLVAPTQSPPTPSPK